MYNKSVNKGRVAVVKNDKVIESRVRNHHEKVLDRMVFVCAEYKCGPKPQGLEVEICAIQNTLKNFQKTYVKCLTSRLLYDIIYL